jgi:hypothetical protein
MSQTWEYGVNQYTTSSTVEYVRDQLNLAGKRGGTDCSDRSERADHLLLQTSPD